MASGSPLTWQRPCIRAVRREPGCPSEDGMSPAARLARWRLHKSFLGGSIPEPLTPQRESGLHSGPSNPSPTGSWSDRLQQQPEHLTTPPIVGRTQTVSSPSLKSPRVLFSAALPKLALSLSLTRMPSSCLRLGTDQKHCEHIDCASRLPLVIILLFD